MFSPLVDVALATLNDLDQGIEPNSIEVSKHILEKFITFQISYQDALSMIVPLLHSSAPVEKIEEIRRTPDMPISFNDPFSNINSRSKTRSWNSYEDRRLLAGIHRFGLDSWQQIANFVGNGRTKAQCSQRWYRGLNPKIEKNSWSNDQDEKLLRLVSICGDKSWTKIANMFGNRSDVQCRYRYKQLQRCPDFERRMTNIHLQTKDTQTFNNHKSNQSKKKSHNTLKSKHVHPATESSNVSTETRLPPIVENVNILPENRFHPCIENSNILSENKFPPIIDNNHVLREVRFPNIIENTNLLRENRFPPILDNSGFININRGINTIQEQPHFMLPAKQEIDADVKHDDGQISMSGSFYQWQGQIQPSPSTNIFWGISPNDSFSFHNL